MVSVIILANGKSERFKKNKLLIKINNQYLINKTISCFEEIKEVKQIILVSDNEVKDIIENKNLNWTNGGPTRFESVKKGLNLVTQDYVLIHDGARPFLSKNLIEKIIFNLKDCDAVIPSLKLSDCLKQSINNKVVTVNRENYFLTQTPQGFKSSVIKQAYEKCDTYHFFDDCQVIENLNLKIKYIDGEKQNKKITYPCDLEE